MSLINQMLQDLEARRATQAPGLTLPSAVRPLPALREPRRSRQLLLASAVLALAAVALWRFDDVWLLMRGTLVTSGAGHETSSAPPAYASNPAASAAAVPAEPPTPAVSAPLDPVPLAHAPDSAGEPLRLSEQLQLQPAVTSPAAPEVLLSQRLPMAPVAENGARSGRGEREKTQPLASASRASAERGPAQERGKSTGKESGKSGNAEGGATEKVAGKDARRGAVADAAITRSAAQPSARERAEADYRQAIAAINQGRLDEGANQLREALRLDALHAPARQLLVRLQLEARQTEAAMQVLAEGLEVLPAQIGWAMSLARLHAERDDYAAAWRVLQHSEPAAGANADYQGFAGHVLQRLGKPQEAAQHYRRALRSAPDDGRWWLGLGLALDAEGRSDEARDAWQTARRSGKLSPELQRLVEQKLR